MPQGLVAVSSVHASLPTLPLATGAHFPSASPVRALEQAKQPVQLTAAQHKHHHLIISTQHIHLDHSNCMEIVVIRGKPSEAQQLLGAIKGIKGIKFSALSTATTADGLP